MALTLTEAAKLSNDVVRQGVIETIIKDSPVLQVLPFQEIVGNSLTYNRENENAEPSFYDVGDTWTEGTPTFTQKTATLRILGTDADVDQYLATTRSNVNDLEAEVLALRAKAVRHKFDKTFVSGDVSVEADGFDGIREMIVTDGPASQVVTNGADGGALTLEKMDELMDVVKGRTPDIVLMSKRERRSLAKLARTAGYRLETNRDEFGRPFETYAGVRIAVHDDVATDEEVGESSDCGTIYVLSLGPDGIAGLTGPGGLQVEELGPLETKDAHRWRIKWYVTVALYNALTVGAMTGVRPVA
ncbi:MAG: phage major capsid protein [Dehalococcoidia bacterium]|nr:phage major capsid protein [Dehalococcoidia bacterium]